MNRLFGLSAWLVLSVLMSACSSLNPFANESKYQPAELVSFNPTVELRTNWQASIGSSNGFVLSPAVVGSSVYVGSADGSLSRLDNGILVWSINVGQVVSAGVASNGKLAILGTPKGDVLAFDAATGKAAWSARVSSEVLAAPAFGDGLVLVRSGDSRIYGFDANDGKRRWVYQRSTPSLSLRSHVGVVMAGHALLAGFPGGKLVALSASNGALLWEGTVALPKGATELERVADITSVPVIYGGSVCAVAYQGRVACFEINNGNPLWSRDISSSAGLDIDQKGVYVSDVKGVLQAFDRVNGSTLWKQDQLSMRGLSKPLAFSNYVVVADSQGVVHLLRREDGRFVSRFITNGGAVVADPQPFRDGFVVQTQDGSIYALSEK